VRVVRLKRLGQNLFHSVTVPNQDARRDLHRCQRRQVGKHGRGVAGRPCLRHGLNSAGRCAPDTGPARDSGWEGRFDIRLDLENLFDTYYIASSYADVWTMPGAPRNVRVTPPFPLPMGEEWRVVHASGMD
jgi:iron complex outermembrane receptor protein